jgi:hypothetical protein
MAILSKELLFVKTTSVEIKRKRPPESDPFSLRNGSFDEPNH